MHLSRQATRAPTLALALLLSVGCGACGPSLDQVRSELDAGRYREALRLARGIDDHGERSRAEREVAGRMARRAVRASVEVHLLSPDEVRGALGELPERFAAGEARLARVTVRADELGGAAAKISLTGMSWGGCALRATSSCTRDLVASGTCVEWLALAGPFDRRPSRVAASPGGGANPIGEAVETGIKITTGGLVDLTKDRQPVHTPPPARVRPASRPVPPERRAALERVADRLTALFEGDDGAAGWQTTPGAAVHHVALVRGSPQCGRSSDALHLIERISPSGTRPRGEAAISVSATLPLPRAPQVDQAVTGVFGNGPISFDSLLSKNVP